VRERQTKEKRFLLAQARLPPFSPQPPHFPKEKPLPSSSPPLPPPFNPPNNRTSHAGLWSAVERLAPSDRFLALALPAIGQAHVLALPPPASSSSGDDAGASSSSSSSSSWLCALEALCAQLARVEAFYDSMGGLVGYQRASLRLVIEGTAALEQQQQQQQQAPAADNSHQNPTNPAIFEDTYLVPPPTLDLAADTPEAQAAGARAVAQGVLATPRLAEVWPVGGAGDRLGLQCESTGEPLPAAMLPYAGRPILESLVRDLQAREYLHWRLKGEQCVTPLAIMTSDAKGNDRRIRALLEEASWYGRGRDTVRLVRQPLVPVLDASDGRWLLSGPLSPAMKPGGHGAIWKLLRDEGVFEWLCGAREQGGHAREAALLRQISNPMAGTDTTLLALAGAGYGGKKEFGFMSCERVVGAAEGMNVLRRRRRRRGRRHEEGKEGGAGGGGGKAGAAAASTDANADEYVITNVEYTEFEKLGMSDVPLEAGSATSAFPANTNILYVGLEAARRAVDAAVAAGGSDVLPGLIFNLKKKVAYADPLRGGEVREVRAGRMESTMQNLADQLGTVLPCAEGGAGGGGAEEQQEEAADAAADDAAALAPSLSTFLVRNVRRKVTSSAKKRRPAEDRYPSPRSLHQTPDGSFLDLMNNARELLLRCGLRYVPPVGDAARYLEHGPGFVALFHPALGPLWDVIAQKVQGGALMDGSELVLEVAEARLRDVTVEGSLLVLSDAPLGHTTEAGGGEEEAGEGAAAAASAAASSTSSEPPRLVFSSRCGRALLENVEVRNVGVDWRHPANEPWRHRLVRHEQCRVLLKGNAEFEARDCRVVGDALFEVPDGHRMVVTQAPQPASPYSSPSSSRSPSPSSSSASSSSSSSSSSSVFQVGDLMVVVERLQRRSGGGAGAEEGGGDSSGGFVPSWEWRYEMDAEDGRVRLEYRRNVPLSSWATAASAPAAAAEAEALPPLLDASVAGDVDGEAARAAAEARAAAAAAGGGDDEGPQLLRPLAVAADAGADATEGGDAASSAATMYMSHDEVRTVPHYSI
jgi:UTP---glucose-1-phosphate uridylyltransferase